MGSNYSDEEEEEGSKRIVVANGMDFDKKYLHEVTKHVSKDWDVRKLSWLGPPLWVLVSLGFILFAVWRHPEAVLEIVPAIVQGDVNGFIDIVVLYALPILLAATIILPLLEYIISDNSVLSNIIRSLENSVKNLVNVLNVFAWDVWQNLNYWHAFTSHLSDRDPLVVLANDVDAEVSGIFADSPHYGNVFVDSIYVDIEGESLGRRQWLLTRLYDHRVKTVRRTLFGAIVLFLAFWSLVRIGTVNPAAYGINIPWIPLVLVALFAGFTEVVALLATGRPLFNLRFYANTAGLSEYERFLNEDSEPKSTDGDGGRELSNSLSGYGLFYLSKFFKRLVGSGQYTVEVAPELFEPPSNEDEEAEEAEAEDNEKAQDNEDNEEAEAEDNEDNEDNEEAEAEDNEDNEDNEEAEAEDNEDNEEDEWSFEAEGFADQPTTEHAVSAARELLWSGIPPESIRAANVDPEVTNPDVTITLRGVDYHTIEKGADSWWRRQRVAINSVLGRFDLDTESEYEKKALEKDVAGERRGVRIPVKKFMSVKHGTTREDVEDPPDESPELLFDDDWDEDELHYLLLGGGEHQQGINKVVLSLKAEGYENVDVLENAFSASSAWSGDEDESDEVALFPTEYFVSFVGGEEDFFRQDDKGFLLLRHELEHEAETRWIHILIGMSAVGTKVGFLYWLEQFESDEPFDEVEEDVVHFVKHPGPTDFDGIPDIGDLYTDTEWRDRDGLNLWLSEGHSDSGIEESPQTVAPETDGGTDKRIRIKYHELQYEYESADT